MGMLALGASAIFASSPFVAPGFSPRLSHESGRQARNAAPATVQNVGKYRIELRVPENGLYAGEGLDLEFRLSDTTVADPIEGTKGVPNAAPSAEVTMPAMPGMPVVRPRIHSEGVPGDYGLELYFPHGGRYRVALRLTPEPGKTVTAEFLIDVADAESRRRPASNPYRLKLIDPPKRSGVSTLRLAIEDAKSGERVKRFDVAHTKLIHLMIASKDLGWFVHEHPTLQPDGSFLIRQRFPAGGDYLVFADVAPKDRGSQILGAPLRLAGPAPTWKTSLRPQLGPVRSGTLIARVVPTQTPIPVGRTTELAFHLRDAGSGRPVTNLQPYLGAHGHLMIVHRDGGTFVHSHPAEGAAADALLKKGEVRFDARFPRPGVYKAWAQFQRLGRVVTLPFVFRVG